MIPKIIHYCWFGSGEMPQIIVDCIETWKKYLPDYRLKRWDESNCSFDENEYVQRAYQEKRWAYVSDYYRLKALYNEGGIYLDTDIRVRKSFDPLLTNKCFLNFNYDSVIGTAIIGAEPNSSFVGKLLHLYDNAIWGTCTNNLMIQFDSSGRMIVQEFDTNNFIFTYYVLHNYPTFCLNNHYQQLLDFTIYPKELFETGSLLLRHYAIHLGTGSWKANSKSITQIAREREHGCLFEYLRIIVRKMRHYRQNKTLYFYRYQVAQEKGID